jgi:tetratricopeptide (TPR) repeat protein
MAVADWHFERKEYDPAGNRYQKLYAAPDSFSKAYLDGLCFRLAYCHSQKQQWQEALTCLETLFQNYPGSSFDGKASCLYHLVAAHAYQEQATESAYDRYIKAADCYVKNCPEDKDKGEAYFQLGRYHQNRGRLENAQKAFAKVGSDSSHYDDAQQAALRICAHRLQTDVEAFESLIRESQGQSNKALTLYRESLRRAEDCHKTFNRAGAYDGDSELQGYVTLLLARLYLHASEPSPRKALPLLRGFESRYTLKTGQTVFLDMAKQLRLECYLQLDMLKDAEQEIAAIIGKAPIDKNTWAFLNECADNFYKLAKEDQSPSAPDRAARHSEAAMIVYSRLADSAGKDATYRNLYDSLQMRRAELYAMDHKWPQAAALYQEKLQRDPSSADALYNLAGIHEAENKWEDAFTAWNKLARGLNPGSIPWYEARLRTAQALIRLGKHKVACEVIAVTTSRHRDPEDQALKGEFARLQGEFCAKQGAAEATNE